MKKPSTTDPPDFNVTWSESVTHEFETEELNWIEIKGVRVCGDDRGYAPCIWYNQYWFREY